MTAVLVVLVSLTMMSTVLRAQSGPPTTGLVGYWNFNEDTGSVAYDSSGNSYNGTISGAAWVPGYIGSALSFNGTSSYVETVGIPFTNTFSVSAWVNAAVTTQTGYARIAETHYNNGLYLGLNSSGTKYKFIVNDAAGASGTCGAAFGCAEGGAIVGGWHLVTGTYNGTTAILYVDGVQVATETFAAPASISLPLYIGRYYGGSGYGWNGIIDEVRLYSRALAASEVSALYSYTGGTPPTVPGNVMATAVSSTTISLTWSASSDTVGVTGYQVYRNGTLAGTTAGLTYTDTGLAASTTYSYTLAAFDADGNVSAQSAPPATATTLTPDTTSPTVSLTAPAANTTVSGTVMVSASATDNVGIASVQFQLDGSNLGAAVTAAPYSIGWNTATATNGNHMLAAVATDTAGNTATSAGVTVTVSNTITGAPTAGLVGYWTFDQDTGTTATDSSGNGYNGTINGATWVTGYINYALSFNGTTNDVVTPNIPLQNAFSISAWVNPAVMPQTAYGRIAETQYNHGFYLGLNASGSAYQFIVNDGAGATGICGVPFGCAEGGTVTGGWHLVTATYNGAHAILYVDGVQVATETFTAPANQSLPLYIGRYYAGNGYGWNGAIDEVRLYSRALSSAEVSAIFAYTGAPPDTTPPQISITAPAAGATVNGVILLTANATDNVGVTGVQFQLNGTTNLGGVLTGAGPAYNYSWNTTAVADGNYTLSATATDAAGNTASSSIPITIDNGDAPPVISAVSVGSVTSAGATITWTTNELSSSQVAYGTTINYGATTTLNSALVTSHSVTLTGLLPSTPYYCQVLSQNANGMQSSASGGCSFTTGPAGITPSGILVVYRTNGPDNNHNGISDSLELAQYYVQQRGVPQANLLGVTVSEGSAYGQGQYSTFYSEMVTPVLNAINTLGSTNISVILLAGELPTSFTDGSNTVYSVDSALMGIYSLGSASNFVITNGANPYFDPTPGFDASPGRFSHSLYQYNGNNMYLVNRLGSNSSLRGIDQVDQSLYGDLYISPQAGYYNGIAYVESQYGSNGIPYSDAFLASQTAVHQGLYDNPTDADMNIAWAEHYVLASGFPLKWDDSTSSLSIGDPGATFSDGTSAATAPRALFYGGWYNYNKYNNVFQWLAGSVANDLNSGSYFGMQALDHGASAAAYVVSEPFLDGISRPNILYYYLLNGYTFAEASALATPLIGWMQVNEGDPLYAPLRAKTSVIDDQGPVLTSGYPTLTVNPANGSAVMNLQVSNTNGPEVVTAQVLYGPTTSYGSVANSTGYGPLVEATGVFSRNPTISLPWTLATVYHYQIVMTDPAGNVTTSGDFTNTPTVSITAPGNLTTVGGTVQVTANATDASGIASVQFTLDGNNLGSAVTGTGPSYSVSWNSLNIANGTHILAAIATNAEGNSTTSGSATVTVSNLPPPVISGVSAGTPGSTTATIVWTTDQASTSQVAYGTTGSYGSLSTLKSTLTTSHSVTLTNLTSSTLYDFEVLSQNSQGSSAVSGNFTFTTAAPTGPPTAGLLGYWNFNEDTGTVANDSSGNGNNATVKGAIWVPGYVGSALSFNGTTNGVVTPNIPLQNAFSISAWVNPAVTTQTPYGRIAETQYNVGFYLGLNGTGKAYQFIVNDGVGTTGTCGVSYGCAEGGTVSTGWHNVTATYNGANAILYVDGVQVGAETFTTPANESLPLYIGRYYAGNGYGWNGAIDEVRLYSRALNGAEVSAIYSYTAGPPDTTPPTVPTNVTAMAVSPTSINLLWTASTDNVGVAGYQVFRNGTQVGTSPTNSYTDPGLTASTPYSYTVAAYDAAGNVSAQSTPAATATTLPPDTTPPTVSLTAPAGNSTVSGTVTVSATATDNVGVASVQFQLDGANLGVAQTMSPYSIVWDTTTMTNTNHTLTAIATDNYGNTAISSPVIVTVNNPIVPPPTTGLLGYWPFNEDAGIVADDVSGNGNNATITGAAWVPGYIGSALNFNGTTDEVVAGGINGITVGTTFTISAWVNASVTTQTAFGRIAETQYSGGLYLGVNAAGTSYKFIVNNGLGATGTCGTSFGCAEGGTVVSNGWHLITGTYDGTTARLYVDQTQVASDTFTAPASETLQLHIGASYEGGSGWNGVIDEVRLYSMALSAAQISAIYNYTGGPADTTPPTAPTSLTAVGISTSAINLAWAASTDPVGVAGYQVFRNGTMVGTTSSLSYRDTGLATSTMYVYSVTAYDTMGLISAPSSVQTGATQAPAISNILPILITPSGATVTWSTNEPANGQVVYGLTNGYGSGPATSTALTTAHGFALTGLSSATQYHFQVQSVDAAGNVMLSGDNVFTTSPTPSYPVGWTELPNTMYNNVCPPNYYNNEPYPFAAECWRLIVWGGAVADTLRNRLVIWGGGHDNYYGNEIYTLNLNDNPVDMTRVNNPSPVALPIGGGTCPSALSDGNPNARETQNNIAYIANLDLMFSFNGGLACGNGSHVNDTWILNTANLQWQNMNPTNGPITPTSYGQYFAVTGYDPLNQTVFTEWSDTFWMYSYATNTYTVLSAGDAAHFPTYATGAVDPKRQKFFAMGPEYQSTAPQIYMIDLTGAGSYASVNITSQVTGCNGLASAQYPGLVYDYALDRIVGWPNQGNTVYIFDPDSLTCTTQTYANGPVNTPDSNTQGTFGRFQYFPALDAFAVVNAADDNAYILRLSSSGN